MPSRLPPRPDRHTGNERGRRPPAPAYSVFGSRPALVIVAIQNALPIWNDFFLPLVLITPDNLRTLPQGLTVFVDEFTTDWGCCSPG